MGMALIAVLLLGGAVAFMCSTSGMNHDLPRKGRERFAMIAVKSGPGYHWRRRGFSDIKKGNVFMLFEFDGKPVANYKGGYICKAENDANEYGVIAEAM